MRAELPVFVFSFLVYLALSIYSGDLLFWSPEELVAGVALSLITAVLVGRLVSAVGAETRSGWLNPIRWALLAVYVVGPLFFRMAKANLDVAYRVITKRINPGIVKVPSGLKTDFGTALLANSITLTPGTITLDVDKDRNLYVHWINVGDKRPSPEQVYGTFSKWVRRITE